MSPSIGRWHCVLQADSSSERAGAATTNNAQPELMLLFISTCCRHHERHDAQEGKCKKYAAVAQTRVTW